MTRPLQAFFVNPRQQKLVTRSYLPKSPRAVLVWSHGYGEHSGRYVKGLARVRWSAHRKLAS